MVREEDRVFGYFIDRAAKAIKSDLNERFRKIGADITPEQWLLLSKLTVHNGQSQVDLGDSTYKNAPTISRIIDLLCKKGLAERHPDDKDRRKFKIFITQSGRELVALTMPHVVQARIDGWSGLTDEDFNNFLRIINKIFSNLNR
jgi:Transcriptional regulators